MVVEAAHAPIGTEVVVKGPVLLHEEDHVLDRSEIGAGRID
jgi:hypothetical protein